MEDLRRRKRIRHRALRLHGRTHIAALGWTVRDPARSLNILGITGLAELVGLGDVHDHRASGPSNWGTFEPWTASR